MGGTDGHRPDLFDSSSRSGHTDLFDNTRKRKAAAMGPQENRQYDRYEPQDHKKQYVPRNTDLGRLLNGQSLSRGVYTKIQTTLKDQEKTIQTQSKDLHELEQTLKERDRDLHDHSERIQYFKERIAELDQQMDRLRTEKQRSGGLENSLRQLRERRDELQVKLKERDDLIAMGTKGIENLGEDKRRLEAENSRLRQTVTERDTTVSKLNEQIWKVTMAPADDHTKIVLEAQAERTLGMINDLKSGTKVRDDRIVNLEGQVTKMNAVIKGQNQTKADLQREVEGLKRELAKQKEVAEGASQREKGVREAVAEQEALIKRILAENGRLVGLQMQ